MLSRGQGNDLGQAEILRLHPRRVQAVHRQEGHTEVSVEPIQSVGVVEHARHRSVVHMDGQASRGTAALDGGDAGKLPVVHEVLGEKALRVHEPGAHTKL